MGWVARQITRVLGDHRSFPIGAAFIWLVGNATQPLVLFLEKDFALLEVTVLGCVCEWRDTAVVTPRY